MKIEEKIKKLLWLIEKIKKENSLIIVEGKKDGQALNRLGLKNIFILNETGKSLYARISEINAKSCVILTDMDKKGKQLYFLLKKELAEKTKVDGRLRDVLIKLKISHVEGLPAFLQGKNLLP